MPQPAAAPATRSDRGDPAVNLIYLPGTVASLQPFLVSILTHTTWRLRLVQNGADDATNRALSALQAGDPDRIDIHVASDTGVLSHGDVIDQLLGIEDGEHFCLVDSDVLAIDDVELGDLLPHRGESLAWSGLPIWQTTPDPHIPDHFHRLSGPFVRTRTGLPIGGTYVAAYRTADVRTVIDRYGVGFGKYAWDDLPPTVRSLLDERGLRWTFYDTATVVNLLLDLETGAVAYRNVPALVHIGDLSARSLIGTHAKARLGGWLRHRAPLAYRLWSITWIVSRGMALRESLYHAGCRLQQDAAARFFDALRSGTATFATAPRWIGDETRFEAIASTLHLEPRRGTRSDD